MSKINISPVKTARQPDYPQKEHVVSHPELLKKLPSRWQSCRMAATAAGLLAALTLTGCEPPPTAGVPLPPATITETDAMRIITETARSYGLNFQLDMKLDRIPSTPKYVTPGAVTGNQFTECSIQDNTAIDAFDPVKKVGFEYLQQPGPEASSIPDEMAGFTAGSQVITGLNSEAVVLVVPSANEGSESNLESHVKAFLDWLSSEGVI